MAKVLRAPKIDATTMTAMQELASAWVFKRAIQDNKVFRSAGDILEDKKTYDEILNIYKRILKGYKNLYKNLTLRKILRQLMVKKRK